MAAKVEVSISVSIDGLGKGTEIKDCFIDAVAPEVAIHIESQTLEATNTPEALNVGAVDTIRGILIRAITEDLGVDTDYVSTYHERLLIRAGTSSYFCPSGVVYVRNATDDVLPTWETVVFGTQT
jgi:hypothetical protein